MMRAITNAHPPPPSHGRGFYYYPFTGGNARFTRSPPAVNCRPSRAQKTACERARRAGKSTASPASGHMRPSTKGWEIHSAPRSRNPQGRQARNPQWRQPRNPQHAPACVIHSGVSHGHMRPSPKGWEIHRADRPVIHSGVSRGHMRPSPKGWEIHSELRERKINFFCK